MNRNSDQHGQFVASFQKFFEELRNSWAKIFKIFWFDWEVPVLFSLKESWKGVSSVKCDGVGDNAASSFRKLRCWFPWQPLGFFYMGIMMQGAVGTVQRNMKNDGTYCWWFRNPANVDMVKILKYPIIYKVSYMSGGAGFPQVIHSRVVLLLGRVYHSILSNSWF